MQNAAIDNISASPMLTGNSSLPVISPSNLFLNINTPTCYPLSFGYSAYRECAAFLHADVATKMIGVLCLCVSNSLPGLGGIAILRNVITPRHCIGLVAECSGSMRSFFRGSALAHA